MKTWVLVAALVLTPAIWLIGLPVWESVHLWSSYSTTGDTLYVVKITTIKGPRGIPIPERSERPILGETVGIYAVDLAGLQRTTPVHDADRIPRSQPAPGDYEFIQVDNPNSVRLWGRSALWEHLRRLAPLTCNGSDPSDVRYDEQDSRTLYLYCRDRDLAFRFEPPYTSACELKLGPLVGMVPESLQFARFFSLVGQERVYVEAGSYLYELDGCADESAQPIPGASAAVETMQLRPDTVPIKSRLLGIIPSSRIYQAQYGSGDSEVVLLKDHQLLQRFSLPPEVAGHSEVGGKYLAKSNLIIWELEDLPNERINIYSLSLASGEIRRTSMPL